MIVMLVVCACVRDEVRSRRRYVRRMRREGEVDWESIVVCVELR